MTIVSNFKYQQRPEAKWAKRASGSLWEGFALDEFTLLKLKDDNAIRLLPPTWDGAVHYGKDIWVHFMVGPGKATILCLNRMKSEKCPICEEAAAAEQHGREDAAKLKPTRRVLVWVVDRKETPEKLPYLWAMPWTVDRDITALCKDKQTGELYQIDHPDEGYDVYFSLQQKGNSFKEYVAIQLAKRPSAVDQKHLDYIVAHPLDSTLYYRNYDEVQQLFMGEAADEEGRPDTTEVAPTPVHSPAPQHAPAPAPVQTPVVEQQPLPPPPPLVFTPVWLDTTCSVCGEKQYTTPTGYTCPGGHANAPVAAKANGQADAPPPQAPVATGSRTAAMKQRFMTGGK